MGKLIRQSGAALALAVALTACGGNASNSNSTPTPSPSPTPYVASESHFSAVFPATPQKQSQPVNQSGVSMTVTLYIAQTNDEQVAVAYSTVAVAPTGGAIQAGLDGGIEGSAKNVNGTIVTRSNTTFLGQPAEDAVIQAQGSVVHERIVFFGKDLYILEGITSGMDVKHPAYDRMVATFKTI